MATEHTTKRHGGCARMTGLPGACTRSNVLRDHPKRSQSLRRVARGARGVNAELRNHHEAVDARVRNHERPAPGAAVTRSLKAREVDGRPPPAPVPLLERIGARRQCNGVPGRHPAQASTSVPLACGAVGVRSRMTHRVAAGDERVRWRRSSSGRQKRPARWARQAEVDHGRRDG